MNEINPLLMMLMMNGGMGGAGAPGGGVPGQQPAPPLHPRQAVGGGALQNMLDGSVGQQMQYPDAAPDSILNIGGASNIPLSKASGWDQFGGWLNKMPADTRMMMGMQGLSGLANILRGN